MKGNTMKNRLLISAFVMAVVSATGPAQVPGQEDRGPDQERRARGEGRRDQGEGGRRGGRRGFGRMFDRIAEQLELDDEQMRKFDEIRDSHREKMEQFRARWQAVRQAREDGNDELAAELRDELRAEREEGGGPREMMRQIFESLDPILTGDQRGQLAEMRERYAARRERGEGRRRGGWRGPGFQRTFERIPEELELDDEQMRQFEEIKTAQNERMEQFRQRRASIRQAREDGDDELSERLRSELRADMEENGGPRSWMRQAMESLDPILSDEQRDRLSELREGDRNRRGGGERRRQNRGEGRQGNRTQRMMAELPDRLELDGAQREQYAALTEASRLQTQERRSKMQPLLGQLQQARESEDQARIDELQAQIKKLRPDRDAAQAEFLKQVEEILREDQKERLGEYRSDLQFDRELDEVSADLRTVLRAAMRLRLTKEQKAELKKIHRNARKSWKEARRADKKNRSRQKDAQVALAATVKARIMKMLDEQQAEQYVERLKRANRSRERRSRNRTQEI